MESLKVINSETNKFYYDYIRLNKTNKTKTDLLNLILARYPDDDAYYEATNNRLIEIQKEYFKFVNKTSQSEPSTFISRYISTSQLPIIPKNIEIDGQLDYLKSHSLDNVDFNDAGLIFSDAFTNKTIEYLTYYRNPQLPSAFRKRIYESR
ncbi:MAG: hypothetical protein H6613_17775 [Ignavibacteriales bacterium]|nr:hypothetical protein [Ignavibacteriales bacterium]